MGGSSHWSNVEQKKKLIKGGVYANKLLTRPDTQPIPVADGWGN